MSEAIVYVRMPPDGEPKPCLEHMLTYALGLGYLQCDPPGEKPEPVSIAPDDVAGQTIEPEPVSAEVVPRRRRASQVS